MKAVIFALSLLAACAGPTPFGPGYLSNEAETPAEPSAEMAALAGDYYSGDGMG